MLTPKQNAYPSLPLLSDVDNLIVQSDCCLMKAIIPLAVMAMAGSAFADRADEILAHVNAISAENEALYQRIHTPIPDMSHINDAACKPSKVDYTIYTLPDGKTASALTYH